jgi:hypothetical protein
MALKDMWRQTPQELEGRHIEKIIAWAGDGNLRDGGAASNEFREYLELIPSQLLADYCEQCLDQPFDQSGLALQDLVNQLGKRLGFEVEFGRYRGNQAAIGFDGIWTFSSGHQAVIEVKKTSAYQVRLDTIATYRARLIESGKLSQVQSSVLIIVGRDPTADLEAQIRGSRHAWDVRLIGIEAVLRLLSVKEELEDPTIVRRIHEILIPREFTKLDEIVELLFSAASDLRPSVEPETPETTAGELKTTEEATAVATFVPESIEILEQRLGVALVRQTRSSWASADGSTVVICKASRTYIDRGDYAYWFGLYEFQMEMITAAQRGYCALQCGGPDQLLLLPAEDLSSWLDLMNRTESKTRLYWHIHISADFHLIRKPGSPTIDLRRYLIK